MNITKFRVPIVIGTGVSLAVLAVLVITQSGKAQIDDIHPQPIIQQASDSWSVDVKHACLVETETVEAGTVTSESEDKNFRTQNATDDPNVAKGTDEGKAACKEATEEARKALPKKLWDKGNELCKQWEKAPEDKKEGEEEHGKKDAKQCKAVRGNLHGPDIKCDCKVERQAPGSAATRNWKAKATCSAPAVKYVCDP